MMRAFKENLADLPHFEHENWSESAVQEIREAAIEELKVIAHKATKPTAILSAEEVSTFSVDELRSVQEFMSAHFEEIEIVLYVRPVKSLMESTFQEILKTRFTGLEERFGISYMGMSRKFDSVFGEDNVKFFRFSREAFPQGSVVTHFLAHAGITDHIDEPSADNTRLCREAVQLLYIYRLYYPHVQKHDRELVRILSTLEGIPFYFHSELFHKLLHTGPRASQDFEKRSGFSLDENLEAHDDTGIRTEKDLTVIPWSSLKWLHRRLRLKVRLKLLWSRTPRKIAQAVNNLA